MGRRRDTRGRRGSQQAVCARRALAPRGGGRPASVRGAGRRPPATTGAVRLRRRWQRPRETCVSTAAPSHACWRVPVAAATTTSTPSRSGPCSCSARRARARASSRARSAACPGSPTSVSSLPGRRPFPGSPRGPRSRPRPSSARCSRRSGDTGSSVTCARSSSRRRPPSCSRPSCAPTRRRRSCTWSATRATWRPRSSRRAGSRASAPVTTTWARPTGATPVSGSSRNGSPSSTPRARPGVPAGPGAAT